MQGFREPGICPSDVLSTEAAGCSLIITYRHGTETGLWEEGARWVWHQTPRERRLEAGQLPRLRTSPFGKAHTMTTADWTATDLAVRSLTGVRQRVIFAIVAAAFALPWHLGMPGHSPLGMEGLLTTTVEIEGEQVSLACRGEGNVTALFLARDGEPSTELIDELQDGALSIARVCSLTLAGQPAQSQGTVANVINSEQATRIALDIGGMLADRRAPTPFVLITTVNLEPVVTRILEREAGLTNGALLIDPTSQFGRGWVIDPAGGYRQVILETADQALLALRSLIWPPAA